MTDNNSINTTKKEVEEFYDTFKAHQKKLGVNIRHRTIFKNLKKVGLTNQSNVIEIGCGIGTLSSLIIKYLSSGSFVGVDISKESIEMAQQINAGYKNASFVVSDMSTFSYPKKFDVVVLPDVLEHIPVEQHTNLFKILNEITTNDAFVLINIPEPNYLNWVRRCHPEKLQIIDQSLSMQDLLNNFYPNNFKLYSLQPYCLHTTDPDYLTIVLKKNMYKETYVPKNKLILGFENVTSKLA
ncbi:MAG: class I SAM-dependent methyltransferase [Bacteroidia bacterium]